MKRLMKLMMLVFWSMLLLACSKDDNGGDDDTNNANQELLVQYKSNLQNQVQSLTAKRQLIDEQIKQLQEDHNGSDDDQINALKLSLETINTTIKELENQIKNLTLAQQNQFEVLNQKIQTLTTRLNELEQSTTEVKEQIDNRFGVSKIEFVESCYYDGFFNYGGGVEDYYDVIGTFENFGFTRFNLRVLRLKDQKYTVNEIIKQINQAYIDVFKIIEKSNKANWIYQSGSTTEPHIIYPHNNPRYINPGIDDKIVQVSINFKEGRISVVYKNGKLNLEESINRTGCKSICSN